MGKSKAILKNLPRLPILLSRVLRTELGESENIPLSTARLDLNLESFQAQILWAGSQQFCLFSSLAKPRTHAGMPSSLLHPPNASSQLPSHNSSNFPGPPKKAFSSRMLFPPLPHSPPLSGLLHPLYSASSDSCQSTKDAPSSCPRCPVAWILEQQRVLSAQCTCRNSSQH